MLKTDRIREEGDDWLVASRSTPGLWHRVSSGRCDCPAFIHRQKCFHVELLIAAGAMERPRPPVLVCTTDEPF